MPCYNINQPQRKLRCLWQGNKNCTLKGCLNKCPNMIKSMRIGQKRHQTGKYSRQLQRIMYQADLIQMEFERQEYEQLKKICPILQRTDHIEEAIAECWICQTPNHCQTSQQQQTLESN